MDFLVQADATTVAHELGIEEYVAKIIIDAAKKCNNRIISVLLIFLNPISWCLFNDFVFSGFDMNVC